MSTEEQLPSNAPRPYTLTLKETRTGRFFVQREPWDWFADQWVRVPADGYRVSGWLATRDDAAEFAANYTDEHPRHVGAGKRPSDYPYYGPPCQRDGCPNYTTLPRVRWCSPVCKAADLGIPGRVAS